MNNVLEQVLEDLAAENEALDRLVADLDDAGWHTPTPAPGWNVAAQVAHLAWTDVAAGAAATDQVAWDLIVRSAMSDAEGFVHQTALVGARDPRLLEVWRECREALAEALRGYPDGERMPWFGPPMSATSMATARFMETWAHGLDVAEALGVEPEPSDRIRHVAHLGVRTRDFAFGVHGITPPAEAFRVELVAPSGEVWAWGPADAVQRVIGPAYDFCLRVTRRRHRDDLSLEAQGVEADRWLDLAQAFAGPPGPEPERRS